MRIKPVLVLCSAALTATGKPLLYSKRNEPPAPVSPGPLVLPKANNGDHELAAPPGNVRLATVALGHGIQNYTCRGDVPSSMGALAILYDVTKFYPGRTGESLPSPEAFYQLPLPILQNIPNPFSVTPADQGGSNDSDDDDESSEDTEVAEDVIEGEDGIESGDDDVSDEVAEDTVVDVDEDVAEGEINTEQNVVAEDSIVSSNTAVSQPVPGNPFAVIPAPPLVLQGATYPFVGVHYFDGTGAPTFDLRLTSGIFGRMRRVDGTPAPASAFRGLEGTGAVPWLKLEATDNAVPDAPEKVTAGAIWGVYRVNTAGGEPDQNKCRAEGSEGLTFSERYSALYWIYVQE